MPKTKNATISTTSPPPATSASNEQVMSRETTTSGRIASGSIVTLKNGVGLAGRSVGLEGFFLRRQRLGEFFFFLSLQSGGWC